MNKSTVIKVIAKIGELGGIESLSENDIEQICKIFSIEQSDLQKIMNMDITALEGLLNARENVVCGFFPAEDDDSEEDDSEDDKEDKESESSILAA